MPNINALTISEKIFEDFLMKSDKPHGGAILIPGFIILIVS